MKLRYIVYEVTPRALLPLGEVLASHGPEARKLAASQWKGKKLSVSRPVAQCRTCGRFAEVVDEAPEGEQGDILRCSCCDDPQVRAGKAFLSRLSRYESL